MEIVAGLARGLKLLAPQGSDVRPTAVRARKALFDSLGSLSGLSVTDLFAGSGALGLEAASRGAAKVAFVESSKLSCDAIRENCRRLERAGASCEFRILHSQLPGCAPRMLTLPAPDFIFADPPYDESGRLLLAVLESPDFARYAEGAALIWEMPDTGLRIDSLPAGWKLQSVRQFGPARFMTLRVPGK